MRAWEVWEWWDGGTAVLSMQQYAVVCCTVVCAILALQTRFTGRGSVQTVTIGGLWGKSAERLWCFREKHMH